MRPGVSHALIAAAITVIVSGASMVLGGSPGLGMAVAIGFYLGRERRQAEEAFGSNRIPPLLLARTADLRP